ncbi:MAG: PD40 domain-containing protein [Ardenticatenaceae bacterium]|nr:PD40 domain-containing protein [Anaerolineales bacterium]MCB8920655.1 PD40 domain-containing protein [Ardenticatenaceae bacterium]MCB9002929.1 PD40 domain-containing protein [Ardenticatenaceae bacterium]
MKKMLYKLAYLIVLVLIILTGCSEGFSIEPPLSCDISVPTTMYRPVKLGASSAPEFIWSPNGQNIAYRNSRGELFILMNVIEERERAQQMYIGTGSGLSWSPDGSKITYLAQSENAKVVIIVETINGKSLELTEEDKTLSPPIWSTVNEKIVFTKRTESHSMEMVSANVGSGYLSDSTILIESAFGEDFNLYSWSPDGNLILLEKVAVGKDINLFTYAVDSNTEKLIAELTGCEREGVWAPDSEDVAFSSNHNGNWDIFIASVHEQNTSTNLTNSLDRQDFYPTWSAFKDKIVFVSYHTQSDSEFSQDLFIVDPDGKNLMPLTNSPEHETYPLWSPNEPYLGYLVFDGINWSIKIAKMESSALIPYLSISID